MPIAGRVRVSLEILQVGNQQDHLEQQVKVLFGFCRDRHHDRVAAPVFRQQTAIGELLLNPIGLRVGFIDFVDRDNDRNACGFGMVDGFERLRHHAVVGRYDQHDDIGDFCSARAHPGKRLVARRIDEDDFAAVLFDMISADVLGDAAGFAVRNTSFDVWRRGAKFYRDRRGP